MRRLFAGLLVAGWTFVSVQAAELRPATIAAFDRYIRATEVRMAEDLGDERFLAIDRLPDPDRRNVYDRLRRGLTYIQSERSEEDGTTIPVPGGLVHHWVGVVFVRGATLDRTIAVLQDYDRHNLIYNPGVRSSKLLAQNGDDFTVFLQLYRKSVVTVALNATFDIQFTQLAPDRVISRSYSTRIAELENPERPDGREFPVGKDHGFLWRLYNYWRVDAKDGGVYLQAESVALTRRVPALFAWLVNPLIKSIPRAVLSELLNATRGALISAGTPSESSAEER